MRGLCTYTTGGSTTENHNKIFYFSVDFLCIATTAMVLKEPCLSSVLIKSCCGPLADRRLGELLLGGLSLGLSWKNSSLICQQEDKCFKTKHTLLRQLASITPLTSTCWSQILFKRLQDETKMHLNC